MKIRASQNAISAKVSVSLYIASLMASFLSFNLPVQAQPTKTVQRFPPIYRYGVLGKKYRTIRSTHGGRNVDEYQPVVSDNPDRTLVAKLLKNNRIVVLKPNTIGIIVQLAEAGRDCRLRILNGRYTGQVFWIPEIDLEILRKR